MYSYRFTIKSIENSRDFKIKSNSKELIEGFINDLLFVFSEPDPEKENFRNITTLNLKNTDLHKSVNLFVKQYQDKVPPIKGFEAVIKRIGENENFYFIPKIELSTEESLILQSHLKSLKEGIEFESLKKEIKVVFGDILKSYDVYEFGASRKAIGEPIKKKRSCRFCGLNAKDITFKTKAHAISEALGNKKLILLEECDACNQKFSEIIEPDIIEYLSLYRSIFQVKGKGGVKKLKGSNFKILNDDHIEIQLNEPFGEQMRRPPFTLPLKTGRKLCTQNIYKALCKYFISLVSTKELVHFKKTIRWLNVENEVEDLPKVAELFSYEHFTLEPNLTYFLRKDNDYRLPHVLCELRITCVVLVFIIPFSDCDRQEFLKEDEREYYWNKFKHFSNSNEWRFHDLSSNEPKEFSMSLTVQLEE
tara:strand:- start:4988 stop:6247 length:1260 start_codon:yes stop_codon:yes gene_type:complete